jgi:hypothetical protein
MRFWGNFGIFGLVRGSLTQKTGLLRNLGIFRDFWSIRSGLGPACKYFLQTKGPAITLTYVRGLQQNIQQVQGLGVSFTGFIEFLNYFSMKKPVHRVHDAVDRWHGRVHGGPAGGTNIGRSGASPAHDA